MTKEEEAIKKLEESPLKKFQESLETKLGYFTKHSENCPAPLKGNSFCNCVPSIFPKKEEKKEIYRGQEIYEPSEADIKDILK